MNDKNFNDLLGRIFNNVDDMKAYLKQLQNTMNVDDKLYYHVQDFLFELDRIDNLVLNYSLAK